MPLVIGDYNLRAMKRDKLFKIKADFLPAGDQQEAIRKLTAGINKNLKHQVLLGVTGSGKTFTAAKVIEAVQKPVLVISHNKTLAAQLYQEFRDLFPQNAVSYFVSYYDYYQPEAYLPTTDTYIAKETDINELIDRLRLEATANIVSRRDVIIVASVSCLYGLGAPGEFFRKALSFSLGDFSPTKEIWRQLVEIGYERNDFDFRRGVFRMRGENIDIFLSHRSEGVRLRRQNEVIREIVFFDPVTGKEKKKAGEIVVYPARHYLAGRSSKEIFGEIRKDMEERVKFFKKQGKLIEAQRIKERVNYDLEMIAEMGYVNGIENYSRYFDGRQPGEPPYTLIDYFSYAYQNDWLLLIDESHMTIPQIRGMYRGDYARKKTLVEFGFRLPAAFDNRPLRFREFLSRQPLTIYMSATPDEWELSLAKEKGQVVEQLIRPTGLLDPKIVVRSPEGQIDDLIREIKKRVKKGQRTLVLTITKRLAEDLADFLEKENIKTAYLHADIDTLDRSDILENLRRGKFDVLVGVNLLREGLDLPEVSLVAILDADKEGFLRDQTSLIQVMGRASRHPEGHIIMFADKITKSMKKAIEETLRRRKIQEKYNATYKVKPKPIIKEIKTTLPVKELEEIKSTPKEEFLKFYLKNLENRLELAKRNLQFEEVAFLTQKIKEVKSKVKKGR